MNSETVLCSGLPSRAGKDAPSRGASAESPPTLMLGLLHWPCVPSNSVQSLYRPSGPEATQEGTLWEATGPRRVQSRDVGDTCQEHQGPKPRKGSGVQGAGKAGTRRASGPWPQKTRPELPASWAGLGDPFLRAQNPAGALC